MWAMWNMIYIMQKYPRSLTTCLPFQFNPVVKETIYTHTHTPAIQKKWRGTTWRSLNNMHSPFTFERMMNWLGAGWPGDKLVRFGIFFPLDSQRKTCLLFTCGTLSFGIFVVGVMLCAKDLGHFEWCVIKLGLQIYACFAWIVRIKEGTC